MEAAVTENQIVDLLRQAYANAGWIGLAVVAIPILLNFYRTDKVQTVIKLMHPSLAWENLHPLAQHAHPFVTASLTTMGAALMAGVPLSTAILGAVPAGGAGILFHEGMRYIASSGMLRNRLGNAHPVVKAVANTVSLKPKEPVMK